jgi:phage anti-repressor protein
MNKYYEISNKAINYQKLHPEEDLDDIYTFLKITKIEIDIKWIDMFWDVLQKDWVLMDKEQILLLGYTNNKHIYNSFSRKLKKNFIENINYKLVENEKENEKKKENGGHNRKMYEITPDTLKTLIMEAKTKNGADIRQYFLKVETLFLSYFDFKCKIKNKSFENEIENVKKLNHIKEFSKNENIKRLENKIENAIGLVYFIREEKTSYYKIGFTSHLKKRLEKLQTGNRKTLNVYKYFYCNSPNVYENLIHKELQEYHVKGEWYKLEKKIIKTIIKKYEN